MGINLFHHYRPVLVTTAREIDFDAAKHKFIDHFNNKKCFFFQVPIILLLTTYFDQLKRKMFNIWFIIILPLSVCPVAKAKQKLQLCDCK